MSEVSLSPTELALLRSQPVRAPKGQYLSVAPRTAVFQAQVNGSPISDSATLGYYAVAYDNVTTGSFSAVLEDMTVDFGTTPGARDIGSTRVRWRGADANFLYFTETAPAALAIVDNCYITVVEEYRPWMVLPRGVGVKNGQPYTNDITLYIDYDQGFTASDSPTLFFRPKANITRSASSYLAPKPAGFVDDYGTPSEKTYRTVTLSAWLSFTFTSPAFINIIDWDVVDGTIISGTSASTTITVRFPAGFRYIKLTVTDSVGITRLMHYPIWAHNDAYYPLTRFNYTRNVTNDWREMELDFFAQDTSPTVIPRGTALCYWKIPGFSPIPEAYRDQFLAWAKDDTTLFRKYQARNTVTLMGLGGWLEFYRSFPLRVYNPDPAAVDTWFEMYDITLNRLTYYVLEFFSTATRIANFYPSADTSKLKALDITGETQWQQLKYISNGNHHLIRTSSLNEIWVRKHYSYMTLAERAAVTPLLELTDADWEDRDPPKILRREHDPFGWVTGGGSGLNGTTNALFKAGAPGRTPDDGAQTSEAPYQNLNYATAQTDINWLTGQELAHLNNPRESVPFNLIYPLDCVEPAWGLPIEATSSSSDSGLVMNQDKFIVKEVNLTYENGDPRELTSYSTEGETIGDAGQMMEVEVDDYTPGDTYPPIDIILPPTPGPTERLPIWDGTNILPSQMVALSAEGAQFAYSTSLDVITGAATWVENSTGLGSGYGIWLVADPYNYAAYFALMSDGVYYSPNPKGGTAWTLIANNNAIFGDAARIGIHMEMSINYRGYIAVGSGNNAFAFSFDYGDTWTVKAVDGAALNYSSAIETPGGTGTVQRLSFSLSPRNSHSEGYIYACRYTGSGNGAVYRTTDWGENWTTVATGVNFGWNNCCPIVPYTKADGSANSNGASQHIILIGGSSSTTSPAGVVQHSSNGGTTWTLEQSYAAGGGIRRPAQAVTGWALMAFTGRGDVLLFASRINSGVAGVFWYEDYGATQISSSALWGTNGLHYAHVNGSPTHIGFGVAWLSDGNAGTSVIRTTVDQGVTWATINPPPFFAGNQFCANVQIDISALVPAA